MRFLLQFTVKLPFKSSLLIRIFENKTEGSLNKEDCKSWVTSFGSLQLHVASRNVKWGSDCIRFVLYCLFASQCGEWIYKRLVLYMTFEYFNYLELKDTVFVNRADTSQK